MTRTSEPLAEELKTVRRGRGLHHAKIEERIGPELRRSCGVSTEDTTGVVRTKLIEKLNQAAGTLPEELALSARTALGIQPETYELLQLQDRIDWLAAQLRRDIRTARRRVDEACGRLAEVLVSGAPSTSPGGRGRGWHVADAYGMVLLDADGVTAVERRQIVADRDALDQITLGWSLRAEGGPAGLGVKVLYGGILVEPEQSTGSRREVVLSLPRPLRLAERHEYALITQLPATRTMQEHYAYTPLTGADHYHLRIRFDPDRAPQRLWRVADAFHRDLDERSLVGEPLTLAPAGDVEVEFDGLLPGYGYGVQWS